MYYKTQNRITLSDNEHCCSVWNGRLLPIGVSGNFLRFEVKVKRASHADFGIKTDFSALGFDEFLAYRQT